jgi:hypothetical protein
MIKKMLVVVARLFIIFWNGVWKTTESPEDTEKTALCVLRVLCG